MVMKIEQDKLNKMTFIDEGRKTIFLKVFFDIESHIAYMTWYDYIPLDVLIEAYLTMGRHFKANNFVALKGLSDLTLSTGSFDQSSEWMVKEYLPRAIQRGYHKTAFVKSKDFFVNLSLEFFDEENTMHLVGHTLQVFETFEQADAWLKS